MTSAVSRVGRCCDAFLIDSRRLDSSARAMTPKAVLATVGVRGPVDYTVVNGRIASAKAASPASTRKRPHGSENVCENYLEQ